MDLLPTGSETKIFELKTRKVNVVVKSKKAQPIIVGDQLGSHDSTIVFLGDDIQEIRLKANDNALPLDYSSQIHSVGFRTVPLFFEQSDYEIVIKGIGNTKVGFWHENFHIRNKVEAISEGDNILTGIINFGNNIGQSDLFITVDGVKSLIIRIEVFPSKISYKEDYKSIITDITNEIYSVVFDFLTKTYESCKLGENVNYTPTVFITIIRTIFLDFIKAADIVIQNPHHILLREHVVLPAHKVRKTDSLTIKWLEKHPESVSKTLNGLYVSKSLSVKKHITYNTIENQFTKHILVSTIKRLNDFSKRYSSLGSNADLNMINEVEKMKNEINRRVYQSFLTDVDDYIATQSMSLVFSMAPGYRDLYKYYLMLQKGLEVNGDIFKISIKDTAQLYEYWCFIKLNSLMKNNYMLVSPDVIKIDNSGITVSLVKGRKSEVKYINPRTGEQIVLTYNPGEQNTQTVNQKPDNVLTLEKIGSDIPYKYVFDAKYRIDLAIPGTGYPDTKPGPKVDDINSMHRYRDSIVYKNDTPSRFAFEKTMFGAYVLFPYSKEEEYTNHRFYRSIETVNIGGLPFLPGAIGLVEKLLTELIMDSRESAFERASLPRGIERKLAKVDWSVMDMLVGSLNSTEQLQINLDKKFYYVPVKFISESDLPVRYVALYQSDTRYKKDAGIRYYGTVSKTSVCKRKDILVPMTRHNEDELYYRFDVKAWDKLDVAINVRDEGVYRPKFTNMFLFRNCRDSYELFNIHSEEQYRLLQELKRISSDTAVNNDEHNPGIKLNNEFSFVVLNGDIMLFTADGKLKNKIPVTEFIRRPRYMFNKLKEDIKCV